MESNGDQKQQQVSRFRQILPQVLAALAKNLLVLDIGMSYSFVTIALPALRGVAVQSDSSVEPIFLTDSESTWFVAVGSLGHPFGSLISGWVTEPFGRKRSMQLAHIPHLIGWMIMYSAAEKWHVFVGAVLFSFGVGLMEAPILAYVSEISEPAIRNQLLSLAMIAASTGYLVVYLLGAMFAWRRVALFCWFCPLIATVVICFVPDSPVWLLSKCRDDEAQRALQWLRGWVGPEAVAAELNALRDRLRPKHGNGGLLHQPPRSISGLPLRAQVAELLKPATMRPFALITVLFVSIQFGGYTAIRPYMVQLFMTLRLPLNAHWAIVGCAVAGVAGATICTVLMRWLGKRVIYMGSVAVCVCCLLFIAILAADLPSGTSSFDKPLPPLNTNPSVTEWALLGSFYLLVLMTTLGIYTIVFGLLSEVFPFRTRSIATGIACTMNFCMNFTLSKMFHTMERSLTIAGLFIMYACVLTVCFFYALIKMPDTENRTLDEVEDMYI